jgi:crotonobetainyl-CoA:carnitine CoA-transferase CaiB-like acyl-CoA transferase
MVSIVHLFVNLSLWSLLLQFGCFSNQSVAQMESAHAAITSIASVASPLRLTATPPVLHRAPPGLGEHADEVLAGLGLDAAAIASLRAGGVV